MYDLFSHLHVHVQAIFTLSVAVLQSIQQVQLDKVPPLYGMYSAGHTWESESKRNQVMV